MSSALPPYSRQHFGIDFTWGAATAAYQVEGAANLDGRGPSIWDTFTHRKRINKSRDTGDVTCDFYHQYNTDLTLLKRMGFTAFRFSISWSRILPEGVGSVNEQGIAFYERLIDTCLSLGIEPWLTLYHWDLPQALEDKGGWTNRAVVDWFSEFVRCCIQAFGQKVKHWIVLNEPVAFTSAGYFAGLHAPGRRGLRNFLPAVHHAVLCQAEGGRLIREGVPNARIGTTFFCAPVEPFSPAPRHVQAAARVDALVNRLFIEPSLGLNYPVREAPVLKGILTNYAQPGDMERARFDFDFIGLQHYYRLVVKHHWLIPYVRAWEVKPHRRSAESVTAMGWEVYPEGMYRSLRQFAAYDQVKEIIVTENGAAFADEDQAGQVADPHRVRYFQDYLQQVLRARQEGIPVRGYFAWSLMDNFEWAEGFRPRFGLVYVDYPTQQRTMKQSGRWFQQLLTS